MGGKKRQSSGGGSSAYWNNIKGWKQVDTGDEFLLGSEEYGFMGLEELDPALVGK